MLARFRGYRALGVCLVFTNGCFDLLHLGHAVDLESPQALEDRFSLGIEERRLNASAQGAGSDLMPSVVGYVRLFGSFACVCPGAFLT